MQDWSPARLIEEILRQEPICEDWLLERGGLETPVSREAFRNENSREYWRTFALKSVRSSRERVRFQFCTAPVVNP